MFTDGLETVASSLGVAEDAATSTGEADSLPSPTAGMRLSLFENEQNPVTFFSGEGELMSAVWSANGDEMTAFANTFLINDLRNALPLLNGYTLNIDLQSALSLKLSGSIEISIWYRTSHSIVANELVSIQMKNGVVLFEFSYCRGSFVLGGKVSLHSSNDKTIFSNDLAISTEAGVNFITDLDFYADPFKMCLQLDQTPISIKYVSLGSH